MYLLLFVLVLSNEMTHHVIFVSMSYNYLAVDPKKIVYYCIIAQEFCTFLMALLIGPATSDMERTPRNPSSRSLDGVL